jgi:uncharacterized protein YbjT (DUF2867 family)
MRTFIIGITGGVGGLLADRLLADPARDERQEVAGLVRRQAQRDDLATRGVDVTIGDLGSMGADELADAVRGSDAIVFAAGSNAGDRAATDAIDGAGLELAIEAARRAGVDRFVSLSVMPEAWRERGLPEDDEHYFAVKKRADIALVRSDLDWVILRPSLLTDDAPTGVVSLGPAEPHEQIARADVAHVLAEVLHEPRIGRRILEANRGATAIADAVRAAAEPQLAGRSKRASRA